MISLTMKAASRAMKLFLSSTFRDLAPEREAVLGMLQRKRQAVLAMEHFLSSASTPLDTALSTLRTSDLVVLVIGFRAGSLLPDGSGMTYTSAEYDEAVRLGKHVLAFVKTEKKWPWSNSASWQNKERTRQKKDALNAFKSRVGASWTWDSFSTPEELALSVSLSLERWDSEGRPGARKTFASAVEYFAAKNPRSELQLLDFETTLFGRDEELHRLNEFLNNGALTVCILSGRGGIGKSKLVHDWTKVVPRPVVFLKDEPLWHPDSEKEVPVVPTVIVIDDAHRSDSVGRVAQMIQELRGRDNSKLVLSTRPGGSTRLTQEISRHFDQARILVMPELQELTRVQALALAAEVLGSHHSRFSEHLIQLSGNSPLVIVAGGRLIASERVNPAELTTLETFRRAVFDKFLDELQLNGPSFPISPPRPILDLIAALGPVDVNGDLFLQRAEVILGRRSDEILATLDALARVGILTQRGRPVRVLPDVLADFLLEQRCIGQPSSLTTRYADQVYSIFGRDFFGPLMRNLSELDWRLGRDGYGLDLLVNIWTDIRTRFSTADEYGRQKILTDLSAAAVYQPAQVLNLVDLALANPVQTDDGSLPGWPTICEGCHSSLTGGNRAPFKIPFAIGRRSLAPDAL